MRINCKAFLLFAAACLLVGFQGAAFGNDAKDWGAPESFAVVNPVERSVFAKVQSLSGEWNFMTERPESYRLGVGDGVWGKFTYNWDKARKMAVPGIWEAQGLGEPGRGRTWDPSWDCGMWDLNHVYVGLGLYRRTFELPDDWKGGRVWLKVGGVASNAYLWINGQRAAYVEIYCGARKYDVTDLVRFGEQNEITALVRNDVPSRLGLTAVNEKFGGFFRDVELEATPDTYVDDVWARGDFETRSADVRVYVKTTGSDGKPYPLYDDELSPNDRDQFAVLQKNGVKFSSELGAPELVKSIEVTIKTPAGEPVGKAEIPGELSKGEFGLPKPFRVSVPIENCQLWTPETPNLYIADVVLKDASGKAIHGWTERFGVRELKVEGDKFVLNGKPYFLRGGGDHNYDQINLIEPADRDRFRAHMTTYKDAGFNYMRFHTHCPLPEYFESADEKGILLQPETPYYHDVTCEGFQFNPKRDMYELFRTCRRYVSFATYSYGNEGYLGSPLDKELYSWVKSYDPDRLVIHQDGGMGNKPGASDFTTNGSSGSSIINPWTPGAHDDLTVPFIAHEYLNLAIKMDPRYEPRFTGVRKAPVSVAAWLKKLNDVGLDENWGAACIAASEKLQAIYQKRGLESARLDPKCDGYLFWSLVDASIPQGSCVAAQGYLNPFWEPRPNGNAPKTFYRFNGPTALLVTTDLPAPILVAGSKFNAEFKISHYDANAIPAGNLSWSLRDKATGETILEGTLPFDAIEPGFAGKVGACEIAIPEGAASKPVAAELAVSVEGSDAVNSWDYWLFPKRAKRSLDGFAVSRAWRDAFAKLYDGVEPIPDDPAAADPNDGKIWIVDPNEEAYYAGLAAGRRVFAIAQPSPTPNVSLGWWALGTQVGTAFADSPAFAEFPNSPEMTELWFRLVRTGAPDLASKPIGSEFEPLAVGEGRDSYYLYLGQTVLGKGKLLASYALDLTQGTPEATALLDSLLDYVASPAFDPKTRSTSFRATFFTVPQGVVWGFQKPVKTNLSDFMPWMTLYEESSVEMNCRQKSKEAEVVWQGRPVGELGDGKTTFAFVGALGYWSQPKTDGFELSVNGKAAVKFDLPAENSKVGDEVEWRSEDGKLALKFQIGRVEQPGPDFFGVFYLTVDNALLESGASPTFAVKSLGEGSLRWFHVAHYSGLREQKTVDAQ